MQTADNFVTNSAIGTKLSIFPNGFRWKVPSRAAIITTMPELAKVYEISTTSGKNWPSSIATTSWVKALGRISFRVADLTAFMTILCYRTSTYRELMRHLQKNIDCLEGN